MFLLHFPVLFFPFVSNTALLYVRLVFIIIFLLCLKYDAFVKFFTLFRQEAEMMHIEERLKEVQQLCAKDEAIARQIEVVKTLFNIRDALNWVVVLYEISECFVNDDRVVVMN